jgi:hypothetical protein
MFCKYFFELYSSCIGFFRSKGALSGPISAASVSIPDKVLGFFRPYQARQLIDSLKAEAQVSIPDRV